MTQLAEKPSPFIIENIVPCVDGGRFPVKREMGGDMTVRATVYRHGHESIVVLLKHQEKGGLPSWVETEMACVNPGLDLWEGSFPCAKNTRYLYTVEAYTDVYHSWLKDAQKKFEAGQDVLSCLLEGKKLLEEGARKPAGKKSLKVYLDALKSHPAPGEQVKIFSAPGLVEYMKKNAAREDGLEHPQALELVVDRERARFAAWYEMFPRSQGMVPGKSATFQDCEKRLDDIHAMGFDVVYLPPIHPIGLTNRKGKNNSLKAKPGDPGSPYAIGNANGGHRTVEPALGSLADFNHFVKACHKRGMEVALDFAINCSPDHPYVKEHPEWFYHRPDGTIKFAENPPKKYEDIYPLNFDAPDGHWKDVWKEMKDIILFWVGHGVNIFRVDNPHTKPVPFWAWLIGAVQEKNPEVIFLSEAFTRPPMLKMLAKAGFTQSYTYFTWRNSKHELTEYLTELTQTDVKEYLRGNFFTNTPDILPTFLQEGGVPAFKVRFVLAATLSTVYGIYNGFELCENTPVPGKEEYLHSEKYEHKVWDWNRPGNIKEYIGRINALRREHPALRLYDNLRFHRADSDNVLFYSKTSPDKKDVLLTVVNLDPFHAHAVDCYVPLRELEIPWEETYQLHNLLTGEQWQAQGDRLTVRLDPEKEPAALFQLKRRVFHEQDFETFTA